MTKSLTNFQRYLESISEYSALQNILQFDNILNEEIEQQLDAMTKREREKLLKKYYSCNNVWYSETDNYWKTKLPQENGKKKLIKRRKEEDIQDLIVEYMASKKTSITVQSVFEEWSYRRLHILHKISEATFSKDVSNFNRFFKDIAQKDITSITPKQWCNFLIERNAVLKLNVKAFASLKSMTKGIINRAYDRDLINYQADDCFKYIRNDEISHPVNYRPEEDTVFSPEEKLKVETYLKNNPDVKNLAILLLFGTGLRIGELVALKREDIQDNIIVIRRTESRKNSRTYSVVDHPKTVHGFRKVVVPDSYMWVIKKLIRLNPFSEYLIWENGRRLNSNCVRKRLYRITEKVLEKKKAPHSIRRTYASILLDNNVDRKFIENQMGHVDISITENSYHRNRKQIDEKAAILNAIGEFQ